MEPYRSTRCRLGRRDCAPGDPAGGHRGEPRSLRALYLLTALSAAVAASWALWVEPAMPAPVLDATVIIQGINAPIPRQVARIDPQRFPPDQPVALSGFGDAPAIGPGSFGGAGVRAEARAAPGPGFLKALAFTRVDAFGGGRINAGASAEADVRFELHDLIFSGPAGSSVPGIMLLDLDGGFNLIARQISQSGSALGNYSLTIHTTFGGGHATRLFRRFADGTETDTIADSGVLEGYLGGDTVLEFPFLVPANRPIDIFVNMQLITVAAFTSNGPDFFGAAEGLGVFLHTLSVPADGPVFLLPEGFTADSVDGRIVDNRWLGPATDAAAVPAPSSLALLGFAALVASWRGAARARRLT